MKTKLLFISVLTLIMRFSFGQLPTPDYHWPFQSDVKETSGKMNGSATLKGISFVADAAKGNVMQLDGSTGYVTIPPGLFKDVGDISITCWFNWTGGANWERVYSFGYTTPTQSPVRTIYLSPQDGGFGGQVPRLHFTYQTIGIWHDYNPLTIDASTWYFTAFIQKGDTIRFYLNDQKIIEDDTLLVTRAKDLYPDSMNWIGKSHWNDPLYKGMITDLQFFKKALSESDVLAIYNAAKPVAIKSVESNNDLDIYSENNRIFINLRSSRIVKGSVYDITGRNMCNFKSSTELSNKQFKSGIYIIRLNGLKQNYSSKVVVR